jgi:pimeloyl-ACP methyl ester carboxylesterase/protein-tyrosine phosphatase
MLQRCLGSWEQVSRLRLASPTRRTNCCSDAVTTDPSLLRKHSTTESVHVPATGYTYPAIRIFQCPHPQAAKLPQLPLLVFIHGLGGSVAQFHPLITSLVNHAPCLAIDLPGCGVSKFEPTDWEAYSSQALIELWAEVINNRRESGQEVVLICHSMGCAIGASLASKTSSYAHSLSADVVGLVALCPPSNIPDAKTLKTLRRLLSIPGPIFNLWRLWDRIGGTQSASVRRFTGEDAEAQTKRLQIRFNDPSKTPVWRRMAWGMLPTYDSNGVRSGGLPDEKTWTSMDAAILLIAGADDAITPPVEAIQIARWLGDSTELSIKPAETYHSIAKTTDGKPHFELIILQSPASHALIYAPLTVRAISSNIQHFFCNAITEHLSLGWQLQHMTTGGKWDVKNLAKWSAVEPVSRPIAGVFRAMKTLREVDGTHTPKSFVKRWSPGGEFGRMGFDGLGSVAAVVDISHDSPVYDPIGLEDGGVIYRKFPTVSKLPPTMDEVRQFVELIDSLREELKEMEEKDGSAPAGGSNKSPPLLIAVHCHYGYNRTGFFVVTYMVERLGWPLKEAIANYQEIRGSGGIRHEHFIDELYGRYWDWDDERRHALTEIHLS